MARKSRPRSGAIPEMPFYDDHVGSETPFYDDHVGGSSVLAGQDDSSEDEEPESHEVGLAPTSRAKCRVCGEKILKGEVFIARVIFVETRGCAIPFKHHPRCFFGDPHVHRFLVGDVETDLVGFEHLPRIAQDSVRQEHQQRKLISVYEFF